MATRCLAIHQVPVPVTRPPGFEQLYRQYSELVYRTARRITGMAADAEDVLQTVFLRVLSRGDLDVEPRSAEAYFRRAATNASIDVLRRRCSHAETPLDGLIRQPAQEGTPLLKERLRRAIAGLSPEDAELFLLRSVEGWSTLELAEQFGIETGYGRQPAVPDPPGIAESHRGVKGEPAMPEDRLEELLNEMRNQDVPPEEVAAAKERVWQKIAAATSAVCPEFRADLDEYAAGRLEGSRRLLVEDHLGRCSACRRTLAENQGKLRTIPLPVPRRRTLPVWTRWAMAAGLAAAALYLGRGPIDQALAPSGPRATVVRVDRPPLQAAAGHPRARRSSGRRRGRAHRTGRAGRASSSGRLAGGSQRAQPSFRWKPPGAASPSAWNAATSSFRPPGSGGAGCG